MSHGEKVPKSILMTVGISSTAESALRNSLLQDVCYFYIWSLQMPFQKPKHSVFRKTNPLPFLDLTVSRK